MASQSSLDKNLVAPFVALSSFSSYARYNRNDEMARHVLTSRIGPGLW